MGYYDDDETYDQYNGTYVQDVEGWSDQMINDALYGEPDEGSWHAFSGQHVVSLQERRCCLLAGFLYICC